MPASPQQQVLLKKTKQSPLLYSSRTRPQKCVGVGSFAKHIRRSSLLRCTAKCNHSFRNMAFSDMAPSSSFAIDVANDRYPFCIVWTPIPMITWILPFVGHMGICDSHGVIYDFAGPFFVSRDNMAFGRPVKYWCLHPQHTRTLEALRGGGAAPSPSASALSFDDSRGALPAKEGQQHQQNTPLTALDMWDAGLYRAAEMYRKMNYNFFCNNCHSFVGTALEQMEVVSLANPLNRGAAGASQQQLQQPNTRGDTVSLRVGGNTSPNGPHRCGSSAAGCPASASSSSAGGGRSVVVGDTVVRLSTWNMVTIGAQIFLFGRYVSVGRFLLAHLPFFIIVALIVAVSSYSSNAAK